MGDGEGLAHTPVPSWPEGDSPNGYRMVVNTALNIQHC